MFFLKINLICIYLLGKKSSDFSMERFFMTTFIKFSIDFLKSLIKIITFGFLISHSITEIK